MENGPSERPLIEPRMCTQAGLEFARESWAVCCSSPAFDGACKIWGVRLGCLCDDDARQTDSVRP